MRRKNHLHRLAGHVAPDALFHLRRVPMLADVVRGDAFIALGKVRGQLRCAALPGNTTFAIDDQVFDIDVLAGHQRGEAEDGACG